ncbi:competence activator protein Sxy [Klebsiella pneumoniae]|nr:competence activator protein Sxy [Klebsiella pneumoniae]
MRKLVCPRLPQFQACVSPLGQLHTRPLFGGYSLAIDDTVFAMVAEGNIYLKACEQSAAYRVEHRNPLLTLRRHGRIVPLKYYQIDDTLWRDEQQLFSAIATVVAECAARKELPTGVGPPEGFT